MTDETINLNNDNEIISNDNEAIRESKLSKILTRIDNMRLLNNHKAVMLVLFAVSFAVHYFFSRKGVIFNLTPDEFCVTAIAAKFTGLDWSGVTTFCGYYGYVQAIFYVPLFLLINNPLAQYSAMLVVNSFLLSFIPVIVYYLAYKLGIDNKLYLLFTVIICGFYPSYFYLTGYVWNETVCSLIPWLFFLVLYKSVEADIEGNRGKKLIYSVLGGLVAVAAYASHGRLIALVAAAFVLVVLMLVLTRKQVFSLIAFFPSLIVFLFADMQIKGYLQRNLWLSETKEKTIQNTLERQLGNVSSFLDAEKLKDFAGVISGHLTYFFSSTWGFGAICVSVILTFLFVYFIKNRKDAEYRNQNYTLSVLCAAIFLSIGAATAVSSFFKTISTTLTTREDAVIYGRYTENFYAAAILLTLVFLYNNKITFRQYIASTVTAIGVFAVFCYAGMAYVVSAEKKVASMILGIMPLRLNEGVRDLFTEISFVKIISVTLSMLIFMFIISRNKKRAPAIISIVMCLSLMYTNIFIYNTYTANQMKVSANNVTSLNVTVDYLDDAYTEFPSIYTYGFKKERYTKLQFLAQEYEVKHASSKSKITESSFVIAPREENLNFWYNDIYLVSDVKVTPHIYVIGQKALDYAVSKNMPVSETGRLIYKAGDLVAKNQTVMDGESQEFDKSAYLYSNYFKMKKGEYIITVSGENTDDISFSMTHTKGEDKLQPSLIEFDDGKMVYSLSLEKEYLDVRLYTRNKGEETVKISSVVIERGNYNDAVADNTVDIEEDDINDNDNDETQN